MPTPKTPSNPIPESLKDALAAHLTETERLLTSTAMQALATGLLSRQIKALLPHGEFGPWLKANLFVKTPEDQFKSQWRKVQIWMQMSEAVETFVKCETVSHLGPLEWLQAAYLAVTRSEEATEEWQAWLAGVNELFHENTQRDLIIELRKVTEEPWQEHHPRKEPEIAEQLSFEEICKTWDTFRAEIIIHGNREKTWQHLPKQSRQELLDELVTLTTALRESLKA